MIGLSDNRNQQIIKNNDERKNRNSVIKLFGVNVAKMRSAKSWSQAILAEKVNVSEHTILRIENGQLSKVDLLTAYNIAKALETTLDYLLGNEIENRSDEKIINGAKEAYNVLKRIFELE